MNPASTQREHDPLTIDDYFRMAEVGILDPGVRVELINGELIKMPPSGTQHSLVSNELRDLLAAAARKAAIVRTGPTLHLAPVSAPEPDVLALKW